MRLTKPFYIAGVLLLFGLVCAGCAAGFLLIGGAVMSGSSGDKDSGSSGTPPTAPGNLWGWALSPYQILLNWDDSTYETGYTIYRKLSSGEPYVFLTNRPADSDMYLNGGLLPATRYFYQVKALNSYGEEYSNEINLMTSGEQAIQPDVMVKKWSDPDYTYLGNDIYNLDAVSQTRTTAAYRNYTVTYYIRIQNDGSSPDSFRVTAEPETGDWTANYYYDTNNITAQVKGAGWISSSVGSYDAVIVMLEVTPGTTLNEGDLLPITITASSQTNPSIQDAVKTVSVVQLPPLTKAWGINEFDSGAGIVIDSLSDIYLCGNVISDSINKSLLLKYNVDGGLVYSKIWEGNSISDSPKAMAITGTSIYICGRTDTESGGADAFLLKYDIGSAVIEWAKSWGMPGSDIAYGVAIDSNNDIYICGETTDWEGNSDIFLYKYDASGWLVWRKTWGGSAKDVTYGIAIDTSDSIYLCGQTMSWTARGDALLLKLNTSGDVLWRRTWGNANQQLAQGIAIDNTGNIYLAGETFTGASTDSDAFLLKYDSGGNLLSQKSWHLKANDTALGITLDTQGNAYICGKTASKSGVLPADDTGILLVIDNSGILTKQMSLSGNIGLRELKAVTNDTYNIYLTGKANNNSVSFQNITGVVTDLSLDTSEGMEESVPVTGPFPDAPTGIFDITGTEDTGAGKEDVLFLRKHKIE